MRILVTGTAGFIGFSLARRLLADGHEVAGIDGFTTYYDPALKDARHAVLKRHNGFSEHRLMLQDREAVAGVADSFQPEAIIHLAAQAGVRYSLENPRAYVESNLDGTFNVMEAARTHAVKHLMLASTSSVYGASTRVPFRETDPTDQPLTLYAASKKATEAMTHSYAHLWGLPTTAFRFFTVYGPWGRPDMALFKFVDAIENARPIEVYGHGAMARDFTYGEDLVEAIVRLLDTPPKLGAPAGDFDSLSPVAPWRVVNIGGGAPVALMDFIAEIEKAMGREALKTYLPMQAGDMERTFADATLLKALTGYIPSTPVTVGVPAFVDWYRSTFVNIGR
ncbi:MAG: NAD-dependent epimerase/dehydratase family protein [Caulobacteraceae bacterium]